ncbi:hypothetical protein [Peredibacter starrii]|uniref:Uncharacterized protein n=1 Tax=Peredibacter starrii TaxID=28202 RepID=A0AAX4HKV9_9BACT|nr:hypothetical protein [Peredibacter starrii]WPU63889.1 hypothetical protein SOO65_14435 [Peredibacter starrii]
MKFLLLIFFLFSLPGLGQEDEDKHLRDLEAQRRKQTEMAVKLEETRQNLQNNTYNAIEELKKLGHENITAASLLDEKVVKIVRKILVDSPIRQMPRERVKELILDKAKDNALGPFLLESPKVLDFLADVLMDKDALPALMGIFLRKDDLKYYFYLWIGIVIMGYLFKRFFVPVEWVGWKEILAAIAINIVIVCICVTVFYQTFKEELDPLLRVVGNYI